MLFIPPHLNTPNMSLQQPKSSKLTDHPDKDNAMLERECKIASALLVVCGAVTVVLGLALWG